MASLQRARRVLAATVRQAYIDAVVATGLVAVAQEGADLAARLRVGVLRKLEEGESSELDLRLARLAEVQAATRLLEARRNQADALRVLSALVLVPVDDDDLALDPLEAAPAVDPARAPRRADLEAAELSLEAARLELRRARAATMPPVSLGVGVRVEDGETFVGPSVGLTFPIFDRNQEERARALGDVEVAEARLQSLRARVDAEQSTATARRREADTAAGVEGAELQEARAALASIESGVLAGEIDLSTAVLLQTQVLQGEAAVVTLRGLVADARIDELLALDDDVLLGGAP
jgi:outer membrane protein TolC